MTMFGKKHSEETKRKIRNGNIDKKRSKETRIKIRLANIGRKYSDEINKKKGLKREKNPMWKGGRYKNYRGYIMVNSPFHPFKNCNGYVAEHRLIMEKHLGRYLDSIETVHHINSNLSDNRLKNLKLFKNQSEHIKHHSSFS